MNLCPTCWHHECPGRGGCVPRASARRRLSLTQLTSSERARIELIATAGPLLPAPVGKVTKGN